MAERSLTSYGLLCLLSVRPWSAYELTGQVKRSLRYFCPRAETRLYQEPKNLVAKGLARARTEANGRRTRTVYSITPTGRRALERWLEEPSGPPQLESESMLRVAFAEIGTKEALVRTLEGMQAHGHALHQQALEILKGYLDTGGEPFPERLHVNALTGKFIVDYTALLESWARWAVHEVEGWPATGPAAAVPIAWDVLRAAAAEADAAGEAGADAGVADP